MPTISVIIPTYNSASLLKEAIQSVLDQSYTDYEIIVVDDGSTDNTREVVNELNQNSGKVRYHYQANRERSVARNHGISLAKGEYFAFLDADDKFLPDKLRIQVHVLEDNPDFGMAYSHSIAVDENGNPLSESSGLTKTRLSGCIYPEMLFFKGTIITTPTVMVRARILSEIGGFDETMHICEDLDLWRRIAKRYKVLQIEEPLSVVRYRRNEQPPWMEYVQARTVYYQKAIAEDPALAKSIQSRLFSEMYGNYGLDALLNGDRALGLQLLRQSAKVNIFLFLLELPGYLYHYALSRLSRFLRSHFRLLPMIGYTEFMESSDQMKVSKSQEKPNKSNRIDS